MLSGFLAGLAAVGRTETLKIPIFPLKTVLFPGARLPLRVFEMRYMDMVKECLKDASPFGICSIVEGDEVGRPATYADVGTLARIASWDMPELGILSIVTEGGARFVVGGRETTAAGLALAEVTLIAEEKADGAEAPPAALVGVLERIIDKVGAERFRPERRFEDANWVSYRLAEILPLRLDIKQKLLEVNDSAVRLSVIAEYLKKQGLAPR